MNDDVLVSVDPHKASNTLAVMDPVNRSVIEASRFENTSEGYKELKAFVRRWSKRRFAVEGCHGAGRSLSQRLVSDGEVVLDVPPKLAARVRVFSQGHGRKTDRDDAVSIGLAALDGAGVQRVQLDDATVSLRLLCDRREELVALRTQAVCRLHRLLVELTPGGVRRELSTSSAAAVLVRLRPKDAVCRIRRQLAVGHVSDIRALDRKIKLSVRRSPSSSKRAEPAWSTCSGSGRRSPGASSLRSVTSTGLPPRTALPPTTAPPPSTCHPVTRCATGCRVRGIGASTTPCT
jgi:hypothetical protein